MRTRRIAICVRTWGTEEAVYTWKYCKSHLLQAKDGTPWDDQVTILHVTKGKEKERWDVGGPVVADLQTAIQPYNSLVVELDAEPGPGLVEYANRELVDILVLASRGRGAVKKAMMGSTTEYVMNRVSCAYLVVKPMVCAGDTYRMKSAASVVASQAPPLTPGGGPRSPAGSPMFRTTSLPAGAVTTPFNRRVAIAYDTTANGRFLLQWAAKHILEPADNIFVVRAVPRARHPGASFADKGNVQRLAGDALATMPHVTTYNLQGGRKSVLAFVGKEGVDLLIVGVYKSTGRHKGLAVRGNAHNLCNLCACPCLVVPMSDASLAQAVKPTDLALAEEEEELDSCSDAGSEGEGEAEELAAKPESAGGSTLEARFRAFSGLDTLFGRRRAEAHSPPSDSGGPSSSRARMASAISTLSPGSLPPGKYLIEVDSGGGIRSIHHAKTTMEVGAAVQLAPSPLPPSHRIGSDPGTGNRAALMAAVAAGGVGGVPGGGSSGSAEEDSGSSPKAVVLTGSAGASPNKALGVSRLRPPAEDAAGTAFATAAGAAFSGGEASDKDGDVVLLRPLRASTAAKSMDGGSPTVREHSGGNGVLAAAPSQLAGGGDGNGVSTAASSRRSSVQTTGAGGLEELRALLQQQQQEMATLKAQLARLAGP